MHLVPTFSVFLSDICYSRREATLRDFKKRYCGWPLPYDRFDYSITQSLLPQQARIVRRRLDMNATPAMLVEKETDRINEGMLCANVNIKPVPDMRKRSPKHNIFEILGVRNQVVHLWNEQA